LFRSFAVPAFLCLALSTPLRAQYSGDPLPVDTTTSPAVSPGDLVRLRIWREPDLSGEFEIDKDRTVVLPKLGPIVVGAIGPDSLRGMLTSAYTTYLNNPSIEVTVLRRISILGAVRNPGLYPVNATMRLSDALALAGGVAPDGKMNQVKLYRDGKQVDVQLTPATVMGQTTVRSGDQLLVPQKSWFSRNPGIVSALIGAVVTTTVALTR
jgi:protein involved in polysaccharide export with SLBB domain